MNRKNCVSGIFWTLFFLFFLYLDVQMGENASYWPGIIAKLGIALSLLSTLVSGMKWKSEKDEKLFPDSTLLADPPGLFLPGVLVDTDADRIFCLAAHKRNR